jgi:flagellar motor switch/type III secretory pathway protein FliN
MAENTVDLSQLPLRIHIVLSELEMSLAEAQSLAPGAILDLGKTKDSPVGIAINGKLAGQAQLVEIDGKLGVRILDWSEAG